MAENIQALIELLSEEILNYDLGHIRGDEIVSGNPEHIINLLQLAKEISLLMRSGQGGKADSQKLQPADTESRELLQDMMLEDAEGESEPSQPSDRRLSSSNKRRGGITGIDDRDDGEVSLNLEEGTDDRGMGEMEYDPEMDDEAIRLAS
jgi:hypothetical protein